MINYFKKRREFKESIKGFFDDWELCKSQHTLSKDEYCLWVCNGKSDFEDYQSRRLGDENNFLSYLEPWEKNIIWKEVWKEVEKVRNNRMKKMKVAGRNKFNKELLNKKELKIEPLTESGAIKPPPLKYPPTPTDIKSL